MLSGAGGLLSRCTLTGRSHRTIDPLCLENPRPAGAEPTLTENVASPFHAEPRQLNQFVFCVVLSQVSKSQSALHIYPVDRNMESFERHERQCRNAVAFACFIETSVS